MRLLQIAPLAPAKSDPFVKSWPWPERAALRSCPGLWLLLSVFLSTPVFGQLPPNQSEQDCYFAIPVCQDLYLQTNSYTGAGRNPDEINGAFSCMRIGERNSVWYTFEVRQPGNLCFTIIPIDTTDDYDWALFDLTTATCADIPVNPALEVRCNWEFNSGCRGETGPNGRADCPLQMEACVPVLAGQRFALNVSNFTASNSGYTLDFSASSARIYDDVPPQIEQARSFCTGVTVRFNENVLCSTVDSLDFIFSGPGGPYVIRQIQSVNCDRGGAYDREFDLYLSHGIPAAGTYTLTLAGTITDFCGNVAPPVAIPVFMPMPPTASILPPGPPQCIESNEWALTYNGPSAVRFYQWDFGDSTATSALPQPRKRYTRPGERTVTLVITDVNGCRDTAVSTLRVWGNPDTRFELPALFCLGDTLLPVNQTTPGAGGQISGYRWFFGDGSASTRPNPAHVYQRPGQVQVVLAVTNSDGCVGTFEQPLTVQSSAALDFTSPERICRGDEAQFEARISVPNIDNDLLANWEWDFGNGQSAGALYDPAMRFEEKGLFQVSLIAFTNKGCRSVLTRPLSVEQPDPPFAPGDTACPGQSATLTALPEPGGLVSWYADPDARQLLTHFNTFLTPPLRETVVYYATVTTDLGCVSERLPVAAFVPPLFMGYIYIADTALRFPEPEGVFSIAGDLPAVSYSWDFGDGNRSNSESPSHLYRLPGRYAVQARVTDAYACPYELSQWIEVMPPNEVFVPSAFSPNGDGVNDFLTIAAPEMQAFRFTLFDRFGRVLFDATEARFAWDGRGPGGAHAPEGVYIYVAQGVNLAGAPVLARGSITLLR